VTGRKHRCNMEVVAQGIANIASAVFGGISVTGTIAHCDQYSRWRVQSGLRHGACRLRADVHAHCGAAGELHPAGGAGGCAGRGVLEHGGEGRVVRLLRDWRSACVLIATFGLTAIEDLTFGMIAGCALAAALALYDRVKRRRAEF
jgi:SulP family sulfate permease